ncbi:MAG TPA: hypothetical protein VIU64_04640, partial [Polyangia bacterium]
MLLTVPALLRTGQLYAHLRSDLEQLLPPSAPSVLAIRELRARMPGLQSLGVLVDFGPPPAGTSASETTAHVQRRKEAESLLDDLATRVARYPRAEVAAVRKDIAKERRFVEAHLPLLIAVTDLRDIRARLEERLRYEFSRATDSLLSDDGPPPLDFSDIEHKYEGAAPSGLVGDRLTSDSLGLSLLLIETSVFSTSAGEAASLLAKVKDDVAATVAAHPGARGFRIGYTGDVAVSAEETSALEADLTVSTLLVIVAVIGVIILYYRWGRAVPAIVLP